MEPGEVAEQRRHERARVIVRASEAQRAVQSGTGQLRHGFVVRAEDLHGVGEQPFAMKGEKHAPPCPQQKGLSDEAFEPLHLHADGGLAAADPLGGTAQRTCLRDGREGAQEADVELQCHKND